MRLNGKIAFITGAGGGIGRAVCARFLAEGARVAAADISLAGATEAIAGSTAETNAIAIECDAGSSGKTKTACQSGWSPGINPTELKFTAVGLSISDLQQTTATYGGLATWFIADLVNAAGKTGNVGAQICDSCGGGGDGGGGVPEPATWALMILGLGGIGAATRFRSRARSLA